MTTNQVKAEKVEALFWKLVGQAFVAFPTECEQVRDRLFKKALADYCDGQGPGIASTQRVLADVVEEIAQKYPKLAFKHV